MEGQAFFEAAGGFGGRKWSEDVVVLERIESEEFLLGFEVAGKKRISPFHFRQKKVHDLVFEFFRDVARFHDRRISTEREVGRPIFQNSRIRRPERDLHGFLKVGRRNRFERFFSDFPRRGFPQGADFGVGEDFFLAALFDFEFERADEFVVEGSGGSERDLTLRTYSSFSPKMRLIDSAVWTTAFACPARAGDFDHSKSRS